MPHENNSEANQPSFTLLAQYLKDLSFESPAAPNSLRPRQLAPEIKININVTANNIEEYRHEVILSIEAKALEESEILFHSELIYAGVFHLENIQEEHIMPLLYIECPRLLFPFARQILCDATLQGGFPPLLLEPVDFAGLFQQKMQEGELHGKPN